MIAILLAAALAAASDVPAAGPPAAGSGSGSGSVFRESVAVSASAPTVADGDWVSALEDELRKALGASGLVVLRPVGTARYEIVVEVARLAVARLPCPAADAEPRAESCPPSASRARATLAGRASLLARIAPGRADVVASGEWTGDSTLAAANGDSVDPVAALEAIRAATRDLATHLAGELARIPVLEPKLVVGAFDGDGFELGSVPDRWRVAQTLQIFHPTDTGLGEPVAYARLRRTSGGDGYAEIIELHSGADPLVVVPRETTGLELSAAAMIEMMPWQFPYEFSGTSHMEGPAVQLDWGLGPLRDHEAEVSLSLDWLRMDEVVKTSFSAAHAMLGLVKKWQHGPKYVFLAVRAGVAYYLGSPATVQRIWAPGGEILVGNEFWLSPWASFVISGGVRWFAASFPTLVVQTVHDWAPEPKKARDERALVVLMGFRVTP